MVNYNKETIFANNMMFRFSRPKPSYSDNIPPQFEVLILLNFIKYSAFLFSEYVLQVPQIRRHPEHDLLSKDLL